MKELWPNIDKNLVTIFIIVRDFPLLGFPHLWTSSVRPTQKGWLPFTFGGLIAMLLMGYQLSCCDGIGRTVKREFFEVWVLSCANIVKLFLILSDWYHSSEQDSNLGPSRIAVYEDRKTTDLTTQPPWLDLVTFSKPLKIFSGIEI